MFKYRTLYKLSIDKMCGRYYNRNFGASTAENAPKNKKKKPFSFFLLEFSQGLNACYWALAF